MMVPYKSERVARRLFHVGVSRTDLVVCQDRRWLRTQLGGYWCDYCGALQRARVDQQFCVYAHPVPKAEAVVSIGPLAATAMHRDAMCVLERYASDLASYPLYDMKSGVRVPHHNIIIIPKPVVVRYASRARYKVCPKCTSTWIVEPGKERVVLRQDVQGDVIQSTTGEIFVSENALAELQSCRNLVFRAAQYSIIDEPRSGLVCTDGEYAFDGVACLVMKEPHNL